MKERLIWLINNFGESLDEFAKRMKITKATLIHYKKGKTVPNADKIKNLYLSMKNLNLKWFIVGEGEPFKDNIDPNRELVIKLNKAYEDLIECQKKLIQQLK